MTIQLSSESILRTTRAYAAIHCPFTRSDLNPFLNPDREDEVRLLTHQAFLTVCLRLSPFIESYGELEITIKPEWQPQGVTGLKVGEMMEQAVAMFMMEHLCTMQGLSKRAVNCEQIAASYVASARMMISGMVPLNRETQLQNGRRRS